MGGHVELHEDPNQAAVREVKEEVGLDVTLWNPEFAPDASDQFYTALIPPVSIGRHPAAHPQSAEHEHVVFVYIGTSTNDAVHIQYESDRSDEWRWFSKAELVGIDLRDNVRAYANFALDTLARD